MLVVFCKEAGATYLFFTDYVEVEVDRNEPILMQWFSTFIKIKVLDFWSVLHNGRALSCGYFVRNAVKS